MPDHGTSSPISRSAFDVENGRMGEVQRPGVYIINDAGLIATIAGAAGVAAQKEIAGIEDELTKNGITF